MTWAVRAFIVVDLPAPLGPSRPTHVPNWTSRSRPSTAASDPNRLTNPRSLIADSDLSRTAKSTLLLVEHSVLPVAASFHPRFLPARLAKLERRAAQQPPPVARSTGANVARVSSTGMPAM